MKKKFLAAALAAASVATLAVTSPVSGITRGGTLDVDDHPYVGLMVALDDTGAPMWRCSGALISPTVYVTAGHCVDPDEGATGAWVWFESDLQVPYTGFYGYPDNIVDGPDGEPVLDSDGKTKTGTAVHGSTLVAHPDWNTSAFYLYDLGVVILDQPVKVDRYASLASAGLVDTLTKGRNKDSSKLTAVGYGLQEIVEGPAGVGPDFDPKLKADKTRWQADLMIVGTKGVAGIGSINPGQSFTMSGDAKHGGTCFGDSGGPILRYGTDVILGVNSFGLNGNCAGIGGAYRVDQPDDIAFLTCIQNGGGVACGPTD